MTLIFNKVHVSGFRTPYIGRLSVGEGLLFCLGKHQFAVIKTGIILTIRRCTHCDINRAVNVSVVNNVKERFFFIKIPVVKTK